MYSSSTEASRCQSGSSTGSTPAVSELAGARGLRDQPDPEAHRLGEIAVGGPQLADAAHRQLVGRDPRAERAVREDRELRGGVVTVDVGRRIGLGEPERLGLGDRAIERQLVLLEARDDEVARAVDDRHQRVDLVGAMREVTDDRQRGGGGGLAQQRCLGALREHAERGELAARAAPCSR